MPRPYKLPRRRRYCVMIPRIGTFIGEREDYIWAQTKNDALELASRRWHVLPGFITEATQAKMKDEYD